MRGRRRVRIIGRGRAAGSFSLALAQAGWRVLPLVGRNESVESAADGVELLLIATSDTAVASVASAVNPVDDTVVAHCSGSLGLDPLAGHRRRASIHPLMTLPSAQAGAARLVGAWFAVAGDALASEVVSDLGGRSFEVPDERRAIYHAAATVASNHLVALLGQVERLADSAGVPFEAFFDLVRASVDNAEALGPAAALTGPVSRGDWATVRRHLEAIDPSEREGYEAGAHLAARLASGGPQRPI